jgi:hypothetical protein
MNKYRVEMHSAPGMWATYDGYVDVIAEDDEDAIERALNRLKRASFPDRPKSGWVIDSVTRKPA